MANILSRIFTPRRRQPKARFVQVPYYLPVTGGWLPAGSPWNWWQDGLIPIAGFESSAMVEACLSAYSQTVAMCPGDHWRLNDKDGRDRVTNSALSRILRIPNSYQSPSDFMLNLTRSLYADGNAYALALRNDRYEIDELHLMDPRQSYPQIAATGDVFYTLGGNSVIDRQIKEQLIVPQRDVLHVRLQHDAAPLSVPLVGDTPLGAALQDIMLSNAITQAANPVLHEPSAAERGADHRSDPRQGSGPVHPRPLGRAVEGPEGGRHADPDRRPEADDAVEPEQGCRAGQHDEGAGGAHRAGVPDSAGNSRHRRHDASARPKR